MKQCKVLFIIFLCSALLISCKSEAQIYPDREWSRMSEPGKNGWADNDRRSFRRYLIDSTNITGLLVIHKGEIVLDYGDLEENSYIASCRKSILALLYGKYVENGNIDLDKTLGELGISDLTPLLAVEKKARIRDLIAARSGVYLSASNGGDFREFAPKRGTVQPGSHWLYNNWDFNVAGYIFEQESKNNIYDEVEDQLALPLEMQDWDRSLQRKNGDYEVSKYPAYHMWFSTRDMARIGLMMLRNGKWKDKEVISGDWIRQVVTQRTSYAEAQKSVAVLKEDGMDLGYGYMWWLLENTDDERLEGAYSAQGALGQNITVYPKIDVVLAYKTKSTYGRRNSIQTQLLVMKKAVEIYKPN